MTKNKFLSKRLACLLTTALVSTSIFINIKEAKADDFTIANGITVTAADNNGATAGATAIVATDIVTLGVAEAPTLGGGAAGINTGAAALTVGSILTGTPSTLTLSGTGGLIVTGNITAPLGASLTIAMAGTNLTVSGDTILDAPLDIISTGGGTLTLNRLGNQAIAGNILGVGTIAVAGT
jgi:hypothetical protein